MDQFEKAAVIVCLGLNPNSLDKTMQSLVVCSGILDYFRAIHGRGYIMTINFSGTKLLKAKNPDQAQACLREDCYDWDAVIARAAERASADVPESCRYVELVLVGTDEVPCRVDRPDALCRQLKARGIRINSVVIEPGADGVNRSSFMPQAAGGWIVIDNSPKGDAHPRRGDGPADWGMVQLARGTGGLTLMPNTEGKLAIHQLFSEMFRRWGEAYWKSAGASKKR